MTTETTVERINPGTSPDIADMTVADLVALMEQKAEQKRNKGEQTVHYRDVPIGAGHAHGDFRFQFLGSEIPDYLDSVTPSLVDGYVRIAGTSHLIKHDPTHHYLMPVNPHPLVELFVLVKSDLVLDHHEHLRVEFHQPGLYVFRPNREGAVSDQALEQPFRVPKGD